MTQYQIARQKPMGLSLPEVYQLADTFFASGMFKEIRDANQAVVKIIAGQEYGFLPFASMRNIWMIQGTPTLSANALATAVKRSGKYNYRILQMNDEIVEIEFFENGESQGVSIFTIADAKRAGTQNTGKYPRNMLFARAISNGVRWYTPDVFETAVYVPEDFNVSVNEDTGEIIEMGASKQLTTANENPQFTKAKTEIAKLSKILSDYEIEFEYDEPLGLAQARDLYAQMQNELRDYAISLVPEGDEPEFVVPTSRDAIVAFIESKKEEKAENE